MKVVHLNTSDFGGAAMAAINLHIALLEQGVDSHLLTLNKTRNDIPQHAAVDPFSLRGTPVLNRLRYKARRALEVTGLAEDRSNTPANRNLRKGRGGHELFTFPFSFFDVLEHPLLRAAEVVHLHWTGYGMVDHQRFFGHCNKPIVWTLHDMNPFTAGSHHTDADLSFRYGPDLSPQLKDPAKAERYWRYKHDAVKALPAGRLTLVAPSHWLAAHARASAMFSGRACAVIPNGFNTAVFRPQDRRAARDAMGWPQDRRIVLFNAADADNPRKGMQLLIPALRKLHRPNLQLVCVGGGAALLPEDMPAVATGYLTDPAAIARTFAAADLFVLPSLAENLPNTIAEAHLCGTPVAAFRVGGIPEQVDDANGRLAELHEPENLSEAIGNALDSHWNHAAIAEKAAVRYDRRTVASAYRALYPH